MMTKRKGARDALWLGGVCVAALLPLAYIVRKKPMPVPAPVQRLKPWEKSRFLPTSFPVAGIDAGKDLIVLTDDSSSASPIIVGTISDTRIVRRLYVPRPIDSSIIFAVLATDQKKLCVVWEKAGVRPETHLEVWDWRKARRLSKVSFQFANGVCILCWPRRRFFSIGRASGIGEPNTLAIFDTGTGRKLAARPLPPGVDHNIGVSAGAGRGAICSSDGVWAFEGTKLKTMRRVDTASDNQDLYWPSERSLAVHRTSGTTVYDMPSGKVREKFAVRPTPGTARGTIRGTAPVTVCCDLYEWSSNGRLGFGLQHRNDDQGASHATVHVWRRGQKTPIAVLKAPGAYEQLYTVEGDRYLLARGSGPKGFGVRVWDIHGLAYPKKTVTKKPVAKPRH